MFSFLSLKGKNVTGVDELRREQRVPVMADDSGGGDASDF